MATRLWGFEWGASNNEFHSIVVNRIAHHTPYAGDALAASMVGFTSFFWVAAGWLCKVFPEYPVMLLGYLLCRFLLVVGIASLVAAFCSERKGLLPWLFAAAITLTSGFIRGLPLGADPVIAQYLSQTFFSVGLCLLALSLTLRRKLVWSAVILGVAYNVNAMQANFAVGIVFALWAVFLVKTRSSGFRSILKAVLVFAVTAMPTLAWLALSFRRPAAAKELSGTALAAFARFSYPYHYFWSVKTPLERADGLAIPALLLVLVWALSLGYPARRESEKPDSREVERPRTDTDGRVIAAVLAGYIAIGVAAVDWLPSRLAFQLHLFRSDALGYCILISSLGALLLSPYPLRCAPLPVQGGGLPAESAIGRLSVRHESQTCWVLLLLLLVVIHSFSLAALVAAILVLETFNPKLPRALRAPAAALLRLGLIAIVVALLLKGKTESGAFLAFVTGALIFSGSLGRWWGRIGIVALCGYVLFVQAGLWKVTERGRGFRALSRMAAVARDLTPPEACFLLPPSANCRTQLQRGVYEVLKDGAAFLWEKGFETEFIRRLAVMGIAYTPGRPYNRREIELAWIRGLNRSLPSVKKEGVTHVILPEHIVPPQARTLAATEGYRLLAIDAAIEAFP